jgi:gas vesicle protein
LIICLDSDYDYLFPEHSIKAKKINESDYIFQTYTYSIENLKCYSESLSGVCVQATQNTDEKIDFPAFFKNYSETIYPLFLWNLYFYSVKQEKKFTDDKFLEVIKIIDTPKLENNGKPVLDEIGKKVKEKIQKLQQEFPNDIENIVPFSESLKETGLLNSNSYLFIQGHTLYNNVVLMLLKPLCRELVSIHKNQIEELSKEENKNLLEKYAKELSEEEIQKKAKKLKDDRERNYKNSKTDIVTLLFKNDEFKDCFLFKKIENDIDAYLEILKPTLTNVQ